MDILIAEFSLIRKPVGSKRGPNSQPVCGVRGRHVSAARLHQAQRGGGKLAAWRITSPQRRPDALPPPAAAHQNTAILEQLKEIQSCMDERFQVLEGRLNNKKAYDHCAASAAADGHGPARRSPDLLGKVREQVALRPRHETARQDLGLKEVAEGLDPEKTSTDELLKLAQDDAGVKKQEGSTSSWLATTGGHVGRKRGC